MWPVQGLVGGPLLSQVAVLLATLELATTRAVVNERTKCLSLLECPFSVCKYLPMPKAGNKTDPKKKTPFFITALHIEDEKKLIENLQDAKWV